MYRKFYKQETFEAMPSIYSTQSVLQNAVGPTTDTYTQIPGLDALTLTDDFLQFGGTASITLFLGYANSFDVNSFNIYVNIMDTVSGTDISETLYTGGSGIATNICISTVYEIPANTQPSLIAQWKILGSTGITVEPPTTMSFSAIVFESQGT